MAEYHPAESNFHYLKGKVVVLTGGSSGIGAATVTRLYHAGAYVVFGDISKQAADELVSRLEKSGSENGGRVISLACDVCKYEDLYALFKTAHSKFGRVDHAIPCAGIMELASLIDPGLTIESVEHDQGTTKVLDVNLVGTCNLTRIALPFLTDGMVKGQDNKSITIIASVGSFRDNAGACMYQISKHGVMGLMRSTRKILYERDGIRINCICPGVTESGMTSHLIGKFKERNLYTQTSDDVARFIVGFVVDTNLHGKSVYIEAGRGWEFEDGLWEMQPRWLGEEPTMMLRKNLEFISTGALLKK